MATTLAVGLYSAAMSSTMSSVKVCSNYYLPIWYKLHHDYYHGTIDIHKVANVMYRKRIFAFFDRELTYKVTIKLDSENIVFLVKDKCVAKKLGDHIMSKRNYVNNQYPKFDYLIESPCGWKGPVDLTKIITVTHSPRIFPFNKSHLGYKTTIHLHSGTIDLLMKNEAAAKEFELNLGIKKISMLAEYSNFVMNMTEHINENAPFLPKE